jgi:hypothetical protein
MKTVCGFGINDLDYPVVERYMLDGKSRTKVICPFYARWSSMLTRSYYSRYKANQPTYEKAFVNEEWKYVSAFKGWMEEQHWENMFMDKDILFPFNKEYSSKTCAFVPRHINNLLTARGNKRGLYPLGVYFEGGTKGLDFKSQLNCNETKIYLGRFADPFDGHKAWQEAKANLIDNVVSDWYSSGCKSYRADVADALIRRSWQLRLDLSQSKETIRF